MPFYTILFYAICNWYLFVCQGRSFSRSGGFGHFALWLEICSLLLTEDSQEMTHARTRRELKRVHIACSLSNKVI